MANYIITKNPAYYDKIGKYNFCELSDLENLPEKIGFDSETTNLDPKDADFFCVQIGNGINNFIIDFYTSENAYTFYDVLPYIKDKILVMHNACFDLGFCYNYGFIPAKENVRDTMIANKILYNGTNKRNDFGAVMEDILGVIYNKSDQKNINVVKLSQQSTIEYSFNDVDKIIELEETLEKMLITNGQIETYRLHCQWIRALAYLERCGLPISTTKWKKKMVQDQMNKAKQESLIKAYIREKLPQYANEQIDLFEEENNKILVSLTSPIQMIPVFQKLGIKTKNRDGKDSIKEDVITKTKHEFVDMWLNFQEANHRITTFGESILKRVLNDRIYTRFNPMVDTARISTRRGEINFLNFPSDSITRDCFRSQKNFGMIVCDFEGQENTVIGDLSKDSAMVESVVNGSCLHCAFARIIFPEIAHLSDKEIIKKHKDKRTFAKPCRFALAFGGNAFTLHQNLNIPYADAIKIEQGYRELHKGIFEWGEGIFQHAVRHGYIKSVSGWRLNLPEFDKYKEMERDIKKFSREDWQGYKKGKEEYKKYWEEHEKGIKYQIVNQKDFNFYKLHKNSVSSYFKLQSSYKRLSLNNPVQSRAAFQTKRASLLTFEWILEKGYFDKVLITNAVHDELVLESPLELICEVKENLSKLMRSGADHYLTDLKMGAESNIGKTWYSAK